MKALILDSPRVFNQVEVHVPVINKPGQLLIKTHWVSLCGSDIPFFTGSKRHQTYPFSPGFPAHECVGRVIESKSDQFKPGDLVIAIPDENQGLAEHFVAKETRSVPLPPELGSEDASCLIQPLSTVMNAVDRMGNLEGRSISIVGLGSAGLFFCWLLKKRGARKIVGIDPIEYRCQMAERLGADKVYRMRSIEVVHLARQTHSEWEPPDFCIEVVGHQMTTINDCLELVRKRGTVVAFGVPDQNIYTIEYETFFRKNATLIASVTPEWNDYLGKARDLFLACQKELEPWVTHRLPIRDAEHAFSQYEHQEDGIIKVLLDASCW